MNEPLREQLKRAGWRASPRYKGFVQVRRGGIEFDLGCREQDADRLELRYRYQTERTHVDGDEALPADATLARIEDVMTSVYLRIHEKPDVTRVFGGRRTAKPVLARGVEVRFASDAGATQTALDL